MPQPAENLRVRRTRKLLRDALIELIEERGIDRLTVGEIADRAMVSRAAFYRNYTSKFDLVERIFDDAMEALLGTVADDVTEPPAERWVAFFEHIAEYRRFYAALLGRRGSTWFAAKMRASLAEMARGHLTNSPDRSGAVPDISAAAPTADLVATVLGGIFTESITWWLAHDLPSPPRVIARQSAQLAGAVIDRVNSVAES